MAVGMMVLQKIDNSFKKSLNLNVYKCLIFLVIMEIEHSSREVYVKKRKDGKYEVREDYPIGQSVDKLVHYLVYAEEVEGGFALQRLWYMGSPMKKTLGVVVELGVETSKRLEGMAFELAKTIPLSRTKEGVCLE